MKNCILVIGRGLAFKAGDPAEDKDKDEDEGEEVQGKAEVEKKIRKSRLGERTKYYCKFRADLP